MNAEQKRFQDQSDAGSFALRWIESLIPKHGLTNPGSEIKLHNLENADGCIYTLWKRNTPLAHAVVVRDQWNYSVVTYVEVDIPEDKCVRCGFPRREHSYNGACYGLCGEFTT